jgi:hypothetical protein
MKRLFTLSLAMVMAIGFCSASSSVVVAPGASAAAREIVAPAPSVAPAVTAAAPAGTAAAPAALKAADINIPLGKTGKTVNLQELATMKVSDVETMTGKKMGLLRRVEFKLAQKKLRRWINADGTINNKKLAMLASKDMDGDTGFHIGGFALGFLLGLIGVLIAYLINDEKKHNRVKWAWIGLAVIVVIVIAVSV